MKWNQKFPPALITPLLVNALPNILAANIPTNIGRNPTFFASFLIVSLNPFISYPDLSSDLIIFIISSISSLEITLCNTIFVSGSKCYISTGYV